MGAGQKRVNLSKTLSRFWERSPPGEKRDTGGKTLAKLPGTHDWTLNGIRVTSCGPRFFSYLNSGNLFLSPSSWARLPLHRGNVEHP